MLSLKGTKMLVIAPHPDDEIIGCGGTIARVKEDGGKVYVMFLTNGDASDFSGNGDSKLSERKKEIESVARFMEYDDYTIAFEGNSHHLKLDNVPRLDIISEIERGSSLSLEKIKPNVVLVPQVISYNQDHWQAAMASFTAFRPADPKFKHHPDIILSYESPADQWSMTYISPLNHFVSITSDHLKKKIDGFRLYKSQTREHPNLRSFDSLRSLATIRGGQCGRPFAEAFYQHRLTV